jgi:cytochrome c oxidase assembly protein subunit 15
MATPTASAATPNRANPTDSTDLESTDGPPRGRARWWSNPPRPQTLRALALGSLVANLAIVATGGLVRLTDSGLGCPSWPDCSGGSLVPTRQLSWHKGVEFGNRLLTYVVLAAVVAVFIAAIRTRPARPDLRRWAWVTLLGVPAQAVLGGITVLTDLNPWAVAAHFMLSMSIVGAATVLWWLSREPDRPAPAIPRPLRQLGIGAWLLTYLVLAVGTVVTGSGPHAGDAKAHRTGLRPDAVSHLHADLVMLLVGLAVALAVAVTATGAPSVVRRSTRLLVGALAFQAAVGFAQYFSRLPVGLVELHVAGAACIAAAATLVVLSMHPRARA